jgi:hypothetical protein
MHRSNTQNEFLAEKAANFVQYGFSGSRPGPTDAAPPSREEIAKVAYLRAKARGFRPGGELEDWLIAERELNSGQGTGAHS